MKCPVCSNDVEVKVAVEISAQRRVKVPAKYRVKLVSPGHSHGGEIPFGGNIGGSSSRLKSLSSDSDVVSNNPDLVVNPDRARARKGRPSQHEYSDEFERFWSSCAGKKGNKEPAFKLWVKLKPPVEIAIQRWAEWRLTAQWQRGYSQLMKTWLRERGWENAPGPADYEEPAESNGRAGNIRGAATRFLERHGEKP